MTQSVYSAKSIVCFLWLAVIVAAGLTAPSQAAVFESGDTVRVTRLQNIRDDLIVPSAGHVLVEGKVEGDLFCFSSRTSIAGELGRSANFFSRNVDVSGTVHGSLRGLADEVRVQGFIGGSLLTVARRCIIDKEAVIDRAADLYCQTVLIEGTIRGRTTIHGDSVMISGIVEGDLEIDARTVVIVAPAVIRGSLSYESDHEAVIEQDQGVIVVGEISRVSPEDHTEDDETNPLISWTFRVSGLLAAFFFGLILVRIFRPYAEESLVRVKENWSVALAWGFVSIFATVLSLLLLIASPAFLLAGLAMLYGQYPAAGLMAMAVSVVVVPTISFCTVVGAIMFYSGKIVTAFLLGSLLLSRRNSSSHLSAAPLFLGLVILTALSALPAYVGLAIYLGATALGAGGIVLAIKYCRRAERHSVQS